MSATATRTRRDAASRSGTASRSGSASDAPSKAAAAKRAAEERRKTIRLVDAAALRRKAVRRRVVFVGLSSVVIGLFAVATAQATLVTRQRELDEIRSQIAATQETRGRVERDIVVASAPDAILQRAFALGMVRAVDPVYLVALESAAAPESVPPESVPPESVPPESVPPAVAADPVEGSE